MKSSLSSPEEAKRLAALESYDILDSLPEQDYEDITKLAAQICGTPVALISLIDRERQWFKSNRGLSFRDTPREDSFCAHNLTSPSKPLLVEDARLDERFRLNPLVTGDPNIVFYAGEPLVDEDGLALGSLCVIDSQARQLGAGQLEALRILAKQVVTLLTARRRTIQGARLKQQLDRSEARFENLIMASPAATAIFTGRDMHIQQVNAPMLAIWGKAESVIGKPLLVAMPELENQPFLSQLQRVFDTGEPLQLTESVAELMQDGQRRQVWFNHAYKPLYDQDDQIYGVINSAVDVTPQVRLRQQLLQAQKALQSAVDLAQLGIWKIDVTTGQAEFSPLVEDWVGHAEPLTLPAAVAAIDPEDLPRFQAAFTQAHDPGQGGLLNVEYRLTNQQSGQVYFLHSMGQMEFGENGQPVSLYGFSQDITQLRAVQSALEYKVTERTQELQRANQDLKRSNDNLQQFAYVASHDLQEPLRKIQSFSTLLSGQLADHTDPSIQLHLERISSAGARMSKLIKDLLTYSRIATRQQAFGPVSMGAIVSGVLSTLDWDIQRTHACISVEELPIVKGDESQLGQLVQNLLTNALKFVAPGQTPTIQIEYFQRSLSDLPLEVYPSSQVPFYHQISVRDNGVGFEMKFLDRIFQVFQRLHGTNQYPGTGVGLAICQRVVENHGGGITARSEPGQGTTFYVYLPA